VPDPERARDGPLAQDPLERPDAPGGAPHLEPALVQDGHAGGVVAAVLEPAETVNDERYDFLGPDVSDYPAHGGVSLLARLRRARPAHGAWRRLEVSTGSNDSYADESAR